MGCIVLHTGVIYETGLAGRHLDRLRGAAAPLRERLNATSRRYRPGTGRRSAGGRWICCSGRGFVGSRATWPPSTPTSRRVRHGGVALRSAPAIADRSSPRAPRTSPPTCPALAGRQPSRMFTPAIYATVPRPDIRALARPQPLLVLISALAPHLLMLPDEGPSRVGGLREVLRTLRKLCRADRSCSSPCHLDTEPTLFDRHGRIASLPPGPAGALVERRRDAGAAGGPSGRPAPGHPDHHQRCPLHLSRGDLATVWAAHWLRTDAAGPRGSRRGAPGCLPEPGRRRFASVTAAR